VLETRVNIFMPAKRWDDALMIAESLMEQVPGRTAAWIAIAECLHQKGDTENAFEALVVVG
jgi:hypothetical protein